MDLNLAQKSTPRFAMLPDATAWKCLPTPIRGGGQPLPSWIRILAAELPRTAAAFLELDLAHRTRSSVDPGLRAAMRWVAAHANHCEYSKLNAVADALRAGIHHDLIAALGSPGYPGWSDKDRAAFEFARRMTLDSDTVTDAEFAALVEFYGPNQAASMVVLLAYANFQDRLVLGLAAPLERDGPLPPIDVQFASESLIAENPVPTLPVGKSPSAPTETDTVVPNAEWLVLSYDQLQNRLETQRQKPTRLPIPTWDELSPHLPMELAKHPNDIVWYRIVMGYAPELAVPFELFLRTAGSEAGPNWDRLFAGSLFWLTTRAVKCPYCMGHCEMNWEVAGLTTEQISDRSRRLASDDWSSFMPAERYAFALIHKLSATPWEISDDESEELVRKFGTNGAMLVLLNGSRYHYMTRISNGFQLTLERDNVFFDFYNVKRPALDRDEKAVQ